MKKLTDRERLELLIKQVINFDNLFELKTVAWSHALDIGLDVKKDTENAGNQ